MSIEPCPRLDLDGVLGEEALRSQVASFEAKRIPLVHLSASVESVERIRAGMLALRSSNISALLGLTPPSLPLTGEELAAVFVFLRDWDQLTLQNFLTLCSDRVPPSSLSLLQSEAKIEHKWMQEWLMAASDERIHRYPGLPWRSYVRKIVRENHKFATQFLELVRPEVREANTPAIQALLREFLEEKKKVVCIFPKRWGGKRPV